jgi:hypothetical protein
MILCCRFVFCRQRSDERLKRGGEQKSVVVLSSQPYSAVLTPLSQHAGPLYFNRGNAALQEVGCAAHPKARIAKNALSTERVTIHCFPDKLQAKQHLQIASKSGTRYTSPFIISIPQDGQWG